MKVEEAVYWGEQTTFGGKQYLPTPYISLHIQS